MSATKVKKKPMKMLQIKRKAKRLGVSPGKMRKDPVLWNVKR
jgi:hypothetical protein